MYDDIGSKIKGLAQVVFGLGAIISVLSGLMLATSGGTDGSVVAGILSMILGPVLSWLGSLCLYGFGELIEKVSEIARNTGSGIKAMEQKKAVHQANPEVNGVKEEKMTEEGDCILVECPDCGAELYFDKDISVAECPHCGAEIKLK